MISGQVEAYKDLKKALKADKMSNDEAERKGLTVDRFYYLKEWFKLHWVNLVIFLFVIFGFWKIAQPEKKKPYVDKRKSHHGINKYGERY